MIQRHPFRVVAVLTVVLFLAAAVNYIYERTGPDPASTDDLSDVEERLHDRFDMLELTQAGTDERMLGRLPPYPRLLLIAAASDRDEIWKVVAPFADEALDPRAVAREWASSPPVALGELSASGRLVISELLLAYGQTAAALNQLCIALELGVSPRSYWLCRAAQLSWTAEGQDSENAIRYLTETQKIDPSYPLSRAILLCHAKQWGQGSEVLSGWNPTTPWEKDYAASVLAAAFTEQDRHDDAVAALEAVADETQSAGLLLHLARLLRVRSVVGDGDSRWKDAFRAVELALRARNLRRTWRGDSAEAVVIAAEAAIIADDPQQVWTITRPDPDGAATTAEASDGRVLPLAAMGAALTGRLTHAQELVAHAPDGYDKWRVEAEVASVQTGNGQNEPAKAAWLRVLNASTTDEQKLQALRALALEGATDQSILDDLRTRHTGAVQEIETSYEIMSLSGSVSDMRLRQLEKATPLASVRRAELLRAADDPLQAAEVLVDATARWKNPRLLLMAIDCYMDAGSWEHAEAFAQQALAESGSLWPGRATVLRRLVEIQSALKRWAKVALACRALLEIDENDEDARWSLAFAEFHEGEAKQAWRTLKRVGVAEAATPHRAMFLLELARRFSDAEGIAQTALAQLRAFPQDEDVQAMAINAVTMRADRAELPDDVGREVSEAWSAFLERYPESHRFRAYAVHDDENPLAEIEPILRRQANTYREIVGMVREQLLPIGFLDRVVGKPYAAIFPHRPLGFHRAASFIQQDIDTELEYARAATDQACIIDASALYTLALIPDIAPTLIGLNRRPSTTAAGLADLLAADDLFNLPSAGTLAFDPHLDRVTATEIDPEIVGRQQAQIRAMLSTARTLRRVTHPTLMHLEPMGNTHEPAWLLNLDAAKDTQSALWCDDLGLRRLAHSIGVKTFGTLSMLTVAHERGRVDNMVLSQSMQTLVREYVVDLPFDETLLMAVAAEQEWQPQAVATVLSRAASWIRVEPAVNLLRQAFLRASGEALRLWAYAALCGLKEASPEPNLQTNLSGITTAMLCEPWARPEHASAMITVLQELVPGQADRIVQTVLAHVWQHLRKTYKIEESVTLFLHLISQLSESHRQHAVKIVLQPTATAIQRTTPYQRVDELRPESDQSGLSREYLAEWHTRLREATDELAAIHLVEELLRRAGARTRIGASAPSSDFPDLAIWDDSLATAFGLPLVIEVVAARALWPHMKDRLQKTLAASNSRTLIALTMDHGLRPIHWSNGRQTILVTPAAKLADMLATAPLGEAFRMLLSEAKSP